MLAQRLIAVGLAAPIGVHVQTGDDELLELSLFYGRTEIVGGPHDGRTTSVPFWLDLHGLDGIFDLITEFAWQAAPLGDDDDLGPHIALEGVYDGHPVRIRLLAAAPARFPAARAADTLSGDIVERW